MLLIKYNSATSITIFLFFASVAFFIMASCSTMPGIKVQEKDPAVAIKGVSGVGLESQDIDRMSNRMVQEILELSLKSYSKGLPRIIIDSKKMTNESSQIINTSLLTDRIRINLIRSASGNLLFISRENSDAIIEEAKLSNELNLIPADYRLVGRVTSISGFSNTTGIASNFVQVSFELIDLRSSAIVWASFYEIKKVGADDTIYR